jgi:hypothetical protein
MTGRDVGGAVGVDEVDQLGVQGHVAVLVQPADGDVKPGAGADLNDRIGAQVGELTDA